MSFRLPVVRSLLVFLLACPSQSKDSGDDDPSDSGASPSDSSTETSPAELLPPADCGDPTGSLTSLAEVQLAAAHVVEYPIPEVLMIALVANAAGYAKEWGCPIATCQGNDLTLTSNCVNDLFYMEGSITSSPDSFGICVEEDAVIESWIFDQVVIKNADQEPVVRFDGVYEVGGDEWWTADLAWSVASDPPEEDDGSYVARASGGRIVSYPASGDAVLDILSAEDGAGGSYCTTIATTDGCDEEPSGQAAIWGADGHVAVLTFDGDTNCDGCAQVSLDGVEIGTWCR